MARGDEHAGRAIAADIEQQRPGWLVLWGIYSKSFVAFQLFTTRRRMIVTAHYPDALVARMDECERLWRIWPEQEREWSGHDRNATRHTRGRSRS